MRKTAETKVSMRRKCAKEVISVGRSWKLKESMSEKASRSISQDLCAHQELTVTMPTNPSTLKMVPAHAYKDMLKPMYNGSSGMYAHEMATSAL